MFMQFRNQQGHVNPAFEADDGDKLVDEDEDIDSENQCHSSESDMDDELAELDLHR